MRGQRGTPIRIDHPQIGELTLNRERLSIGGAESLQLVVYHADAGSRDAEKLSLLASANLPTAGNTTAQPDQRFNTALTTPQNAVLADAWGTGFVQDDDGGSGLERPPLRVREPGGG